MSADAITSAAAVKERGRAGACRCYVAPFGYSAPLAYLLRFFNSLPSPISFRVCSACDSTEVGKQILGV